jgi:hypothetical protein
MPSKLVRIPEASWRSAATKHAEGIRALLQPGLTAPVVARKEKRTGGLTALDAKHPVYNFLVEYYGLKGAKGPRRLARWSPDPALLMVNGTTAADGILLEGAVEDDFGNTLHLRGANLYNDGVVYSPAAFFGKGDPSRREEAVRAASGYCWYKAVIAQTLQAEPNLHCHGLHEFAMQYQPIGAPPPPSAKYQGHLPLRVSREVINEAVERRGIQCTHIDALKYFAPAAGPLNRFGAKPPRLEQLQLEQPACVHAQMDLIKMSNRLQPFMAADLIRECLEVALDARRLDVAASPYDAAAYGLLAIPIETPEGRADYRNIQTSLMRQAEPVRRRLLEAYRVLLAVAFDDDVLELASMDAKMAPKRPVALDKGFQGDELVNSNG